MELNNKWRLSNLRFLSTFAKFSFYSKPKKKKKRLSFAKGILNIFLGSFLFLCIGKNRAFEKNLTGFNVLFMVDFVFKSNCKQQVIFHLNNGR